MKKEFKTKKPVVRSNDLQCLHLNRIYCEKAMIKFKKKKKIL